MYIWRQIVWRLDENRPLAKTATTKLFINARREVGDFQFVLIQEELSNVSELKNGIEQNYAKAKLAIKNLTTSPESWFGFGIQ